MALFKRRKLQKQRGSFKTTPKEAKKIGGIKMLTGDQIKIINDSLTSVAVFLSENNIEKTREIEIAVQKLQEAIFWLTFEETEEEE
jgi:hypothetical protein